MPVIYVPGNHDFWWDRGEDRYTLADQMSRGRDVAARHGIHLVLDGAVTLGGTRYLCSTLWTDFRLGTHSLTHGMRSAQGRFGMVDYRRIRTGPSSRHRIEPEQVLALHRRTRAFIEATLAVPHAGPTVVVTHHAPHPDSLPDPHADMRWCYASDLRDLIHAGAGPVGPWPRPPRRRLPGRPDPDRLQPARPRRGDLRVRSIEGRGDPVRSAAIVLLSRRRSAYDTPRRSPDRRSASA